MSAARSARRRGGAGPPVRTTLAVLRDRGVPLAIAAVVFVIVCIGLDLGDYPGHGGAFALTAGVSIVLTAVPVLVFNRPRRGGQRPAEAGPYLPLCVGIAIILDAVLPARLIEGILGFAAGFFFVAFVVVAVDLYRLRAWERQTDKS
jgi:hypothetical protein